LKTGKMLLAEMKIPEDRVEKYLMKLTGEKRINK
jgi:hypothetical protein